MDILEILPETGLGARNQWRALDVLGSHLMPADKREALEDNAPGFIVSLDKMTDEELSAWIHQATHKGKES